MLQIKKASSSNVIRNAFLSVFIKSEVKASTCRFTSPSEPSFCMLESNSTEVMNWVILSFLRS